MADKKLKTFVANDENVVNSYGFRVRNAGLNYDRFDQNPVMLDGHINQTESVRGNWLNRRVEGAQVLMDANFDMDDPTSAILAGKVDRGFVKGASFGLGIDYNDAEDCFVRQPDGIWDLVKAEVMELSVCGVPSLSSALALYNKNTGELIAEDDIKLSLQNLSAKESKLNNPKMEKFKLSAACLVVLVAHGLTNAESESDVNASIERLNLALTGAKSQNETLQKELDATLKLQAETLVDGAILEEKILAGEREDYIGLATTNFKLAAKLIGAKPGKVSLNANVANTTLGADIPKTIDDFEKLSYEKKLAFQKDHREAYDKLFE
ncbi:HK97 family phage prohead protease [Mucilaginibacter glaciei]|uniref:Caudovirus prohead protease n=1 Tax=Mucilaginibacter glaciei TaxID=2772109 RepID=A0A926NTE5_9SPHI|nr:hypothetical protein [Mucilaginibacter glaciei]MBD1394267.1 hypothetical protein [Mucilaginibacter glaciei]